VRPPLYYALPSCAWPLSCLLRGGEVVVAHRSPPCRRPPAAVPAPSPVSVSILSQRGAPNSPLTGAAFAKSLRPSRRTYISSPASRERGRKCLAVPAGAARSSSRRSDDPSEPCLRFSEETRASSPVREQSGILRVLAQFTKLPPPFLSLSPRPARPPVFCGPGSKRSVEFLR
jgi:hypothetical protein